MQVMLTLVSEGDRSDESYFGFTSYVETKANAWKWIVLDLGKMELAAEADIAYLAAGSPSRTQDLTRIKLAVHEKDAAAACLIDDLVFYKTLPSELAEFAP
jgi:hypothetical protein